MAGTHSTGPNYSIRLGSDVVRHTFVVSGSTSTTATQVFYIQASTVEPAILEAQICVSTADGGTSPTMSLGYTASGYTDLVNVASTATAATGGTFLPASNATGKKRITADTAIYYKQGGTPDGAGVTTLILDVTQVNTSTVTGL